MKARILLLTMAAIVPLLTAGQAAAESAEERGREQLILAINAAWVGMLDDGTYAQIMSGSAFPGAPAASTYHVNIADCLPAPEVNPYPAGLKGRFKNIIQSGNIVVASFAGGAPNIGDTASYYGPFSDAITNTIIDRIGEHYGVNLSVTDIVLPPPFFETTSVLVSNSQPRADIVDQVNATGGTTQGLVRRDSRRFSCTLAASGQFLHVPARLAATITSVAALRAHPELRICTGNLSTQTMNEFFPQHVVRTERANDIANCDARIAAGTQDILVNSMPSLSVATAAGLVLQNTYTDIDTQIYAGTPLWVAKDGISCTGLYNDAIPDNCTKN